MTNVTPSPPEPKEGAVPDALTGRIAALSPEKRAALRAQLARARGEATRLIEAGESINAPAVPASTPPSPPKAQPSTFLASPAQRRLWFLHELAPDTPAYNVHRAFRFRGDLDVEVLRRCLEAIVHRHDTLRSSLFLEGTDVYCRVHSPAPVPLRIEESDGNDLADRERAAGRRINAFAADPFPLESTRPFRALLVRLDPEDHVLVMVLPHTVSDGWSLSVLVQEISQLYPAISAGNPSPLSPLVQTYAEFAAWRRSCMGGPEWAAQADYWGRQLAGAPPHLELPSDRPRPSRENFRGALSLATLEESLFRRVGDLARRENATAFMVLLAVFKVLLFRYTGQADLVVGTPIANRQRPEDESLIGVVVNTLALRTRLDAGMTGREILGRVRRTALDAFVNQDLPFEGLMDLLAVPRDPARQPIFQVFFAYHDFPDRCPTLPGIASTPWEIDNGSTKFDLSLMIVRVDDTVEIRAQYATDLFDTARIERLLGHYLTLLEGVLDDPGRPIGALPMLARAEYRRLVDDWSGASDARSRPARASSPPDRSAVVARFEAVAARHPDTTALVSDLRAFSYGELNAEANHLAGELEQLAVGPGSLVAVATGRTPAMVVALLAVQKTGGTYLPVDPAHPAERLATLFRDARPTVVITDGAMAPRLPGNSPSLRVLVEITGRRRNSVANPPLRLAASAPAYVIYTSGSNGRPKGVVVEHGHLWSFLDAMDPWLDSPSPQTWLAATHLTFDISNLELLWPLTRGHTVVLFGGDLAGDGIPEQIRTRKVTHFQATPSRCQLLLADPAGPGALSCLRTLLVGGEPLTPELIHQLHGCFGGELINLYGPTETTIWSTAARITPANAASGVPIGRPLANTQVYVVDPRLEPLPIGVPGELLIGGDAVARGYLEQPELTAERFIPNPFAPDLSPRLYRTGDLARWRPEGSLECLGRLDDQLKIRGYRVEPGEIEVALESHPGVRQAAVFARSDSGGILNLIACVLPALVVPPPALDAAGLRAHLRSRIPDSLIPSAFHVLDRFPLTPGGKVDRRALARLNLELLSHGAARSTAPRDDTEQAIVEIWEALLEHRPIGIHDNFFALGGHSLLAMRFVFEARRRFRRQFAISDFFIDPTVEHLARLLRQESCDTSSIKGSGTGPPLFFVPGVPGVNYLPEALIQTLGPAGRYHDTLQFPGVDGMATPLDTVEALARVLIEQVQVAHPSGPLALAGYSLGGNIAFEMARQFDAAGRRPVLVLLYDSAVPGSLRRRSLFRAVVVTWRYLFRLELVDALRFLRRRLVGKVQRRRAQLAQNLGLVETPIEAEDDPTRLARKRLFEASFRALENHRPLPYPGRIVLFRSADRDVAHGVFRERDPLNGWQRMVQGGIEVEDIPGDHWQMLKEPGASVLARKTLEHLRQVQAGIPDP